MLGDFGSGTHMGMLFIQDYLKGNLTADVLQNFERSLKLNREKIIERIYKVRNEQLDLH